MCCFMQMKLFQAMPLGHHVSRKVWCFYMSILEFGPLQLQKEQAWLTVMIQRTSIVNTLSAGVSQLYKILLRAIFLNPECQVSNGLGLKMQDSLKHIFLQFGGILQDGGAHKNTWSVKGDGGTKFCPLFLEFGFFKEQPCIPGWRSNSDIRYAFLFKFGAGQATLLFGKALTPLLRRR